ncbi:MAG: hypothetical protein Q4G70_04975 [Pseudomonadota bacterium]|nr:hypothetical protein [Pseudomonadota bacterium]
MTQSHTEENQTTALSFSQYEGRDDATASVVQRTELIAAIISFTLLGLLAIFVLIAFFSNLFKQGIGHALINAALSLLVMGFIFLLINRALGAFVMAPYRSVQYRGSMKKMAQSLPGYGLQPALVHQWHTPNPGVIALDTQNGVLFINARSSDYQRLFLKSEDIIGVKVERESEVHTTTTHGGSLAVFSRMGFGYNFGSRSKSKSVVHERAFLEIHFQQPGAAAPSWVAIPFGEARRDADSMAAAIQRLKS